MRLGKPFDPHADRHEIAGSNTSHNHPGLVFLTLVVTQNTILESQRCIGSYMFT